MQDLVPPPPRPAPPPSARIAQVMIGLALVLPAAVALLLSYGWPTARTVWLSTRSVNPVVDGSDPVGFDNYERVADRYDRGVELASFVASLAVPLVLVLVLVAPVLAWLAHRAGRATRLTVRLALAVPMVCFVPVGLAVAWRLDRLTADPDIAPGNVRAALWLGMFGLIVGWGVTCYLAAFRAGRVRAEGPRWAAAGTVAALAVLAAAAIAVSAFTYPFVMTRGGPADSTVTPMLYVYEAAFNRFEFGLGAAHAMVVLVPLMLLGLVAAALVVGTGLRVEVDTPEPRAGGGALRVLALVGAVVGLVAVLAAALYGLWPWLSRPGFGPTTDALPSVAGTLARTWLPPVLSTVVGVGLAAVAAFGIGALRPLGRWSELLLLPFAPWLFVGLAPLMVAKYESAMSGLVSRIDNTIGLIPPIGLVVPALFVLTVLFRGLAAAPPAARAPAAGSYDRPAAAPYGQPPAAPYGRMVLWALPMVGLLACATWLVQSQSLLWDLLVTRTEATAPVWIVRMVDTVGARSDDIGLGLLLPIPLLLALALALAALQLFYLDRLAIRVGRAPDKARRAGS